MSIRNLALPLLLVAALPAWAQDDVQALPRDEAAVQGGDYAIVGVGAAIMPDYDGSEDYGWTPGPGAIGSVGGFDFQLVGNRLSVDLIPDGGSASGWNFQAGPIGVVNFNRASVKGIDNPQVKAMGKLGTAFELGGYVGIGKTGVITSPYDRASLSLSYRHDVSNVHDSAIWTPSFTYITPLSRKSLVGIFVSADRVEDGFADTYFGVTPEQSVASGLPVYNPDGGWKNWTAGLGGAVSITGDLQHGLQLFGGGTYRKLLGDFADSPVTTSRNQWLGVVGLAFSF